MLKVPWIKHKAWEGPQWTKFVLQKNRASVEAWAETLDWLIEQPGGRFMSHVSEYDQYIVVRIQDKDDAFAFKMRWL